MKNFSLLIIASAILFFGPTSIRPVSAQGRHASAAANPAGTSRYTDPVVATVILDRSVKTVKQQRAEAIANAITRCLSDATILDQEIDHLNSLMEELEQRRGKALADLFLARSGDSTKDFRVATERHNKEEKLLRLTAQGLEERKAEITAHGKKIGKEISEYKLLFGETISISRQVEFLSGMKLESFPGTERM